MLSQGAVVARVLQACAAWGVLVPRLPANTAAVRGIFGAAAGAGCGERPPGEARRVDARGLRREGRHRASARRARLHVIWCDSK